MRTPWRFVADLVSRKPKPGSLAAAPNTIALEYKPSPEEEQPTHDETAITLSTESGSEVQVGANPLEPDADSADTKTAASVAAEAPAARVGDEEPTALLIPLQAEEKPPSPTLTEATETLVRRSRAHQKKIKPTVEPMVSTTQTDEVAPAVAAGLKFFTEEMANLDEEIAALRRQLAKKLVEQNAQLRKMLARFDVR